MNRKRYIKWLFVGIAIVAVPFIFRAGWMYMGLVPPSDPKYSRLECSVRVVSTDPERYVKNGELDSEVDFSTFALFHTVKQHAFGREFLNLLQGKVYPLFSYTSRALEVTNRGYSLNTLFTLTFLCARKEEAFQLVIEDYRRIAPKDIIIEVNHKPDPDNAFTSSCPYSNWWRDGQQSCK